MKCSLPDTSSTHAAPHKDISITMFHCRHHAFFLCIPSPLRCHTVSKPISSKNIYLGLITPEYRVPIVFIFVQHGPWQTLGGLFCAWAFRRGFFCGRHPCMPFLCSVHRIVSREIVTPVWLSTSLDNYR